MGEGASSNELIQTKFKTMLNQKFNLFRELLFYAFNDPTPQF